MPFAGFGDATGPLDFAPHTGVGDKEGASQGERGGGEGDEDAHCDHLSDGYDDSGAERVPLRWGKNHPGAPA